MVGKTYSIVKQIVESTRLELWPPDDTEESVMGADLHQLTIINARLGINEAAAGQIQRGQPVLWQALSQTIITGFQRPDGSRYNTLPDVFVFLHAIDRHRGSVSIEVDGPPALIIEVLSESTYESDLNFANGKGWTYAHGGVREYLVMDPTGVYLPERIRAWRLVDRRYQPWLQDAMGRRQSEEIAVAFGIDDGLPAIYSLDGRRKLREGEIEAELARKDDELASVRRQIEELRGK